MAIPLSEMLLGALRVAWDSRDMIVLPTLLLGMESLPSEQTEGTLTVEDRVLVWARRNGLRGDRTRMNLNGYPGLFRDLFSPPPWVEVRVEDTEENVAEERVLELRPLYVHCAEYGYDLLSHYHAFLEQQFEDRRDVLPADFFKHGVSVDEAHALLEQLALPLVQYGISFEKNLEPDEALITVMNAHQLLDLYDRIRFVEILGKAKVESVYWAIFEINPIDGILDDMNAKAGAPDLLVWSEDNNNPFWSFIEVKGPGDRLRESQHAWICKHWGDIGGHFILIAVTDSPCR